MVWIYAALILRQLLSTDITAVFVAKNEFKFDYFSQLMSPEGLGTRILIDSGSSTYGIFCQVGIFLGLIRELI